MSYKQMMKWHKKHPKGTRQPVLMHTNSGFWPAQSWLENEYNPYIDACDAIGVRAVKAETFYNFTIRRGHYKRTMEIYAQLTKEGLIP
jgi:hypothetical protein